jgi:hypothetical protein
VSTIFRKFSKCRFPVGRVKDRKPLGHSGQRRLQEVVGSKERLMGWPHITGRRMIREKMKLDQISKMFTILAGLSFLNTRNDSLGIPGIMGKIAVQTTKSNRQPPDMRKHYLGFIIIFCLIAGINTVRAQQLSDKAQISILTFGPGTSELYSAYGHSAIRVSDPELGFDASFNYGIFDFDQPNFYLNFAKGYLLYMLAIQETRYVFDYYKRNNRSIQEQVLNLTQTQKQKVFEFLSNNAKPENASYYYDYFYDNCATKIGDVFVESLGKEFRFNEDFVDEPGLTIRQLTDRYTAELFPWGKLGIDLCLGMPMDKVLTNMQYTYIPEYVYKAFDKAEISNAEEWEPVVGSSNDIFLADHNGISGPFFSPKVVFWSFFSLALLISVLAFRSNRSLRLFDFLLFFVYGLLGLFFLLLWLATDHNAAAWNLNLLWAWPTHLIVAFFVLKKQRPRWVNWYLAITAGLGLLLVLCWFIIPQALNMALIPLTLVIVVRSAFAILE